MNIIAIAAFGTTLEVGLHTDTGRYENRREVGLKLNHVLLGQIDSLFRDAEDTTKNAGLVLCTRGPGSFTAIRIVMAAAKGFAAGSCAAFIAIPTFDIVGGTFAWFPGRVLPVIDGRKGKFYTAVYEKGKKIFPETDIPGEELKKLAGEGDVLLAGEDAEKIHRDIFSGSSAVRPVSRGFTLIPPLVETGIRMFSSGETCDRMMPPLYIRKSDAELEIERKA
jgi:tRNA threonylcarbamoyladenosine biosynthesis protein TsaB